MLRSLLKKVLFVALTISVVNPAIANAQHGATHPAAMPPGGTHSPAAVGAPARRALVRRPFNPNNKTALPPHWVIAGHPYVNPNEYSDLAHGVMELLKRYPPHKYFFVGLGRDPAPVIAFLQNLGEKHLAVNLPGTSNIQWQNQVGPEDVARHIEAAVPEEILKGDRDIVILDVTSTGKTPAVFGPYFDRYLQGRGINKKVVRLGFSWTNIKLTQPYGPQLTDWIDTQKWADFTNYYTGKYEGNWAPGNNGQGIAEHQRHSMTRGAQPPTVTSPNYAAFRQALHARMEQDHELDGFLSTLAPEALGEHSHEQAHDHAHDHAAETHSAEAPQAAVEAFSAMMKSTAKETVAGLPQRTLEKYPHTKGPYLSENGEVLRGWLNNELTRQGQAAAEAPAIKQEPNLVTLHFITNTLEEAQANNKIRNRDYRRLLGRALSASVMDSAMLTALAQHYQTSAAMKREINEEADEFLKIKKRPVPGTENMAANFRALVKHIDPNRVLPE